MDEVWKDIPGFESRYQVSSAGRVRSLLAPKARVLRQGTNTHGYWFVCLRKGGVTHTREVHVLVAAAFLGPRPTPDTQVRHLDGNQKNNSIENLAYGSRSENQLDTYSYRGRHHKLTVENVRDIRARLARGETGRSIASLYGTSETNISSIKNGGSFAWLH